MSNSTGKNQTKIYLPENVYDMALKRIEYLFSRFDKVAVWFSGGKDSTVCLELTVMVAKKLGRGPVPVIFIDQEGEWQATIDYTKEVMYRDDVEPHWHQHELHLFNSASTTGESGETGDSLHCWGKGEEWIREKDPISIKENTYGTKSFYAMFNHIAAKDFPERTAFIGGVRCEESPSRFLAVTVKAKPMFDWITYGKELNKDLCQYSFYPIYDWSYTDNWKAIVDHGWSYNKLYDYQHQYGLNIKDMRVSNVHHATAITSLYYMQEVEKETWEALCRRLPGINTAGHLKQDAFLQRELPYMFKDWGEYRDHLLKHLITNEYGKKRLKKLFDRGDERFACNGLLHHKFNKTCVRAILKNDYDSETIRRFYGDAAMGVYIRWKETGAARNPDGFIGKNPYLKWDVENGKTTYEEVRRTIKTMD